MSARFRVLSLVLLDGLLVAVSFYASFVLRYDLDPSRVPTDVLVRSLPLVVAARIAALAWFGMFRGVWRYVAIPDLLRAIKATTASSIVFVAIQWPAFGFEGFPRSVFFLDWAGTIVLLSAARLTVRLVHERFPARLEPRPNANLLIIGVGDAAASLCAQARGARTFPYTPVGFISDGEGIGTTIQGVPVLGTIEDIPAIVLQHGVEVAVIASPTASSSRKREIVRLCQQINLTCKILPRTSDLLAGTVSVSEIRDVDVADLLGRPQARLDTDLITDWIRGKTVLVTGAAGSVGSELSLQIARLGAGSLVLVDIAENPLVFIHAELRDMITDHDRIYARVADVTNEADFKRLMQEFRPQLVFHAAAHKHVHLMESAPAEAVRNNIGGTLVVARCAKEVGAESFVLVSTDKAVNPAGVMGATKRIGELLVREFDTFSDTRYVSVRFGNVMGSNASAIPIFKRQIAAGGPITITDPNAARYFMSVTEAASLILEAGALGKGGEIFVLDMGEPLKIQTLAETLVSLSGLSPGEDIKFAYAGLRPGEKLVEDFNFEGEEYERTACDKLLVWKGDGLSHDSILDAIDGLLGDLPFLEQGQIRDRLADILPEYRSAAPANPAGQAKPAARENRRRRTVQEPCRPGCSAWKPPA